ncbi:DNA-binding response regulator, partial [Taibaiella sp. KBW10]|uniref:response regulator n=1 Tax=Taibaiella sp. KBW10 TaxID=2153357 RepID=UPI000F930930
MKIKVSIIEDNIMFREGLMRFIGFHDEFEIGAQFGAVAPFLQKSNIINDIPASILLLDIGLPGISGIDAIPAILNKYPELNIVMLTSYEEEDIILKALCSGACSYLSKSVSMKEIVSALR